MSLRKGKRLQNLSAKTHLCAPELLLGSWKLTGENGAAPVRENSGMRLSLSAAQPSRGVHLSGVGVAQFSGASHILFPPLSGPEHDLPQVKDATRHTSGI